LFIYTVGRIKARITAQSLTVHEGESAALICRTWGTPVDEIQWFKDTRPLTMTSRISIVTVRYHVRFVIAYL